MKKTPVDIPIRMNEIAIEMGCCGGLYVFCHITIKYRRNMLFLVKSLSVVLFMFRIEAIQDCKIGE